MGGGMMWDDQFEASPFASPAWTISPNRPQVGRARVVLERHGSVFNVTAPGQCHWHLELEAGLTRMLVVCTAKLRLTMKEK